MISNIAIGLSLGLIAFGVIGILGSGIRNVLQGKSDVKRVAVMIVPVIIFAAGYLTLGSFNRAGVLTMILMVAAMAISIVLTGTRGTFKF